MAVGKFVKENGDGAHDDDDNVEDLESGKKDAKTIIWNEILSVVCTEMKF